jgi:uncharacterized protein (DUF885 family)
LRRKPGRWLTRPTIWYNRQRLYAIDTSGFPDQEALNKRLIIRDLRMDVDGARFKPWEMPVDQMNGIQINLPQLVNVLPFDTVKDYDDYIARMRLFPRLMDQTVVQMRKGMASADAARKSCDPGQRDRHDAA